MEADVDGRVARLPAGFDPDDFVRRSADGAATFRRMVEGARPMLDQFIQDSVEESSIEGKLATLERVAALLVRVRNQTKRELYAGQLAGVLGLTTLQVKRALQEAATRAHRGSHASPGAEATAPQASIDSAVVAAPVRLPPEELHVIVLLARYPELLRAPEASRAGELLLHPTVRQLYRMAATMVAETGKIDVPAWLDAAPIEHRKTVAAGLMDGSLAEVADPTGLLRKLATRLELLRLDAEIEMSARLSREAHARGDEAAQRALSIRGIELRKTKEGLQAALQRP